MRRSSQLKAINPKLQTVAVKRVNKIGRNNVKNQ
jgi:hypothetical protein